MPENRPATRPGSQGVREEGSPRLRSAGVRACDAYASIARLAHKVRDEMDEVTSPHGIPLVDLDDEDSVVIATVRAKEAHSRSK